MTRLLVSVRNREEARLAIAGGADIVDVKEPRRGSLGAADAQTWRSVRAEVNGRAPLSAALGELRELAWSNDGGAAESSAASLVGFQFAKLGLAGCRHDANWQTRWRDAVARLPKGVMPVAVAYADWKSCHAPPPEDVLQTGVEIGCVGLLIDTFDKRAGDVFHWQGDRQLADWIEAAQSARCFAALAGSLTLTSIPRAVQTGANVIAVRGAVCAKQRTATVDEQRIRNVSRCVKRCLMRAK